MDTPFHLHILEYLSPKRGRSFSIDVNFRRYHQAVFKFVETDNKDYQFIADANRLTSVDWSVLCMS